MRIAQLLYPHLVQRSDENTVEARRTAVKHNLRACIRSRSEFPLRPHTCASLASSQRVTAVLRAIEFIRERSENMRHTNENLSFCLSLSLFFFFAERATVEELRDLSKTNIFILLIPSFYVKVP
jgi:hypothetical protein